jgi:hypothetical protein
MKCGNQEIENDPLPDFRPPWFPHSSRSDVGAFLTDARFPGWRRQRASVKNAPTSGELEVEAVLDPQVVLLQRSGKDAALEADGLHADRTARDGDRERRLRGRGKLEISNQRPDPFRKGSGR